MIEITIPEWVVWFIVGYLVVSAVLNSVYLGLKMKVITLDGLLKEAKADINRKGND